MDQRHMSLGFPVSAVSVEFYWTKLAIMVRVCEARREIVCVCCVCAEKWYFRLASHHQSHKDPILHVFVFVVCVFFVCDLYQSGGVSIGFTAFSMASCSQLTPKRSLFIWVHFTTNGFGLMGTVPPPRFWIHQCKTISSTQTATLCLLCVVDVVHCYQNGLSRGLHCLEIGVLPTVNSKEAIFVCG